MIKATIQNSSYCTEIRFPCSETELSKKLGKCVNFTARHNGDLNFDDCECLKKLNDKISESLPEQQNEAPEMSM